MPQVTQQPASKSMLSDKQCVADTIRDHTHEHKSCHSARLRRIIIPAIFLLLTTVFLAFLEFGDLESGGVGFGGGLLRRAVGDTTNGNNSGFVKHKLYLIVAIVGLVLALIAAIALSFWCCRGSFENPLCCPCYLCACCGGLACLECISCGLCAGIAESV